MAGLSMSLLIWPKRLVSGLPECV